MQLYKCYCGKIILAPLAVKNIIEAIDCPTCFSPFLIIPKEIPAQLSFDLNSFARSQQIKRDSFFQYLQNKKSATIDNHSTVL